MLVAAGCSSIGAAVSFVGLRGDAATGDPATTTAAAVRGRAGRG